MRPQTAHNMCLRKPHPALQKALEDVVLDAVLTSAFDATPEKLEGVRKSVKASLHAMALKAARSALALCSAIMARLSYTCMLPHVGQSLWCQQRICPTMDLDSAIWVEALVRC